MKHPHVTRILVIDDDPLFGRLLCRKAMSQNVRVDYHATLLDALYEHYLAQYDVAIIDCMMPDLSGFEVAEYLKTFLRTVPVVLVSQAPESRGRFLERRSGAVAFVPKTDGADAVIRAALAAAAA